MAYYNPSGKPINQTRGLAAEVRSEFQMIQAGFAMLPSPAALVGGAGNYSPDTGLANAYVVTLGSAITAYTDGLTILFKAANANTGTATVGVNALGLRTITRSDGSALQAGDILAGQIVQASYSTTNGKFQLQATGAAAAATAAANRASAASGSASAAAGSAGAAAGSASNAATSANNAATTATNLDKRYLGAKASDPTTDNQGQALAAGAVFYNTTLNKVRTWTGSVWTDGITAIAGVASVNGASGAVTGIATTGANTFTGDQSLAGKKVIDPLLKGTIELRATAAIASGVLALDLANAITSATLNANITSITFANNAASATACQSHTLELTADGTARTVVWPAGNGTSTLLIKWPAGTAPTLTSANGKRDTFFFKSVSQFLWDAYTVGQNQ